MNHDIYSTVFAQYCPSTGTLYQGRFHFFFVFQEKFYLYRDMNVKVIL